MPKKRKKIKSYLIPLFASLMLLNGINTQAAVVLGGPYLTTATTNALVRAGYALVSTVTIQTTNALGTIVHFYDSATNNISTYVVLPYTNRVVYMTNLVNNYVTTTGITNFFTNRVQISANEARPQTTNAFPFVAVYFVPGPNLPQIFTIDSIFVRGISVSNNNPGVSLSATYRGP